MTLHLSAVPLLRRLLGHSEHHADVGPRLAAGAQGGDLVLDAALGLVAKPAKVSQRVTRLWVGGEVEQGFLGGFAMRREHASRVVDLLPARQAALTIGATP